MVAVYLLWPLQPQLDLERILNLFFNHERAPIKVLSKWISEGSGEVRIPISS